VRWGGLSSPLAVFGINLNETVVYYSGHRYHKVLIGADILCCFSELFAPINSKRPHHFFRLQFNIHNCFLPMMDILQYVKHLSTDLLALLLSYILKEGEDGPKKKRESFIVELQRCHCECWPKMMTSDLRTRPCNRIILNLNHLGMKTVFIPIFSESDFVLSWPKRHISKVCWHKDMGNFFSLI